MTKLYASSAMSSADGTTKNSIIVEGKQEWAPPQISLMMMLAATEGTKGASGYEGIPGKIFGHTGDPS